MKLKDTTPRSEDMDGLQHCLVCGGAGRCVVRNENWRCELEDEYAREDGQRARATQRKRMFNLKLEVSHI